MKVKPSLFFISTEYVICLGKEFQMGEAQKWLKPRPLKFSQVFATVFGSFLRSVSFNIKEFSFMI